MHSVPCHLEVHPFDNAIWTPSKTSVDMNLVIPIPGSPDQVPSPPPTGRPTDVVMLALARCPCAIRHGWKATDVPLGNQADLYEFYSSSSSDIEGLENMTFTEKGKIAWFKEYREIAKAKAEEKKKASQKIFYPTSKSKLSKFKNGGKKKHFPNRGKRKALLCEYYASDLKGGNTNF